MVELVSGRTVGHLRAHSSKSSQSCADAQHFVLWEVAKIHSSFRQFNDFITFFLLLRFETPTLLLACWRGHLETVRELLQQGAQVNAGDMPALLWASRSGHFEVVRQLLGSGADVNAARRHNGCTALVEASRAGRTEVACLLLAHGASRAAVRRTV